MSEPSKYIRIAQSLMLGVQAEAALVVVLGGIMGDGCARAELSAEPRVMDARRRTMVFLLRALADDIEKGITQPDQPEHRRGSA